MPSISVSLPSNAVQAYLSGTLEAVTSVAIRSTMDILYNEWTNIARQELTTTYTDYVSAISKPYFPEFNTGVIEMTGKAGIALEEGYKAFDMKRGFAKGKHVHYKENGGWYQNIPFRHRTPNTSGVAVGGKEMPQDIYAMARQELGKLGRKSLTGTEGMYPPKQSWTGYQHKNGFYEGMQMNTKQYDKSTQNTYVTFRRVSDTSDPASWWHSGWKGVHALQRLESRAEQIFQNNFEVALQQAGR